MRNRSSAIAITNNTKKRMTVEMGLNKEMNEDVKAEKITQFMEGKLKIENVANDSTVQADYHIGLPTPQYLDIKKEYSIKGEKPILFHDKAKVCSTLDKKYIGYIEPYNQHIDFETFLAQFKDSEEVGQLEIQDLLNIDYEKIGGLKERVTEYSEITSDLLIREKDKNELLDFFSGKMNDLKRNESNIQVFINNIDKVDSFCFSENKTVVYFK